MAADVPFAVRDRGCYLPDADAVVVADVHLGRDHRSNVELPLGERASVTDGMQSLLDTFQPAEVVVAGDALHSFSHVPLDVAEAFSDLRDQVDGHGASLVVVAGNHDTMLASVDGIEEAPTEYRLADGTVVCHGHERPQSGASQYVIGHEHPAIEIEGQRRHCFLWGSDVYEGADVLVLPAFSELAVGTRVNGVSGQNVDSPLLARVREFRPVVYDADRDEALTFPRLGDLQAHL